MDESQYTLIELKEATGVPARTIRYYIQREPVDRPERATSRSQGITVTDDFGTRPKSVTIDRNRRSRLTETTGHALPKWAVTMDRNTHSGVRSRA